MAVPTDIYEDALTAAEGLIACVRRYGAEALRDALTEARDDLDEDAAALDNAIYDALAAAVAEAEDVAEGRTRIVILTPDGARITWSWLGDARPDRNFETMVMNSVARTLGMHVPGDGDDADTPEEVTGLILGPHGRSVRYRIGRESGDVFSEGEEFDGLTLTIEVPSLEGAQTLVAKMNSIGGSGLWPRPNTDTELPG